MPLRRGGQLRRTAPVLSGAIARPYGWAVGGLGALVGRSDEVRAADAALAGAVTGRSGTLAVVGPAGIGKSRLLAELRRRSDEQQHLVLAGSASELERDLPFGVFVDAVDAYVESLDRVASNAWTATCARSWPACSPP